MVLKEQLSGININQNINRKAKSILRLLKWSNFSKSKDESFEDEVQKTSYKRYYLPTVETWTKLIDKNFWINQQEIF